MIPRIFQTEHDAKRIPAFSSFQAWIDNHRIVVVKYNIYPFLSFYLFIYPSISF